MANTSRTLRAGALTCLVAGLMGVVRPQAVQAQQQPSGPSSRPAVQQPFRGLFGAGSPAQPGGHILDLTLSVYEEYGNTADQQAPSDAPVLDSGWFTGVRGGLSLEKASQHARFGIRSDASVRYYQESRQTTDPRVRVEMAVGADEGQRRDTTWHLGGSFDYEPYYVLPLFHTPATVTSGTAILPTNRDDLLYPNQRSILGQSFSLEHQLSPRWTFGLFEDLRYTKAETSTLDVHTIHGGVRIGRRFTRYSALRLGYGYRTGRYGPGTDQKLETHDIDFSFDYRRMLPRLRRTTIGFETGSSLVTAQLSRRWEVVGTANLRHEFNEGGFIQVDYARNVRLVEGFTNPLFQNTVSGSLGGFVGRRIELSASGGYSRGVVAFTSDRYRAVQGAARLRLALARYLAIDTEGLIARHTFDEGVVRPDGLPPDLDRWSVRCNVMVWLPLSR